MNVRDSELLARYLDTNDDSAFAQLVEVYGGLVLGSARRVTGETEAAKEAAQATFITLARKASCLRGRESLGGWLHHTAMLSARNLVRSQKREERMRIALEETMASSTVTGLPETWEALSPALDESLASLPEQDRSALVLRFYRGCSVQEVASAMKVSLAAAQKRLGRALDKLRANLQRRGVTLSVSALSSGLGLWAGNSQAAAVCIATWSAKASAAAKASSGSSTILNLIITTMTTSKITPAILIAALLVGSAAIALNLSKLKAERSKQTTGPASSARSNHPRSVAVNSTAPRLKELETQFGTERVRQARRIAGHIQAQFNAEMETALLALDERTKEWLNESKEKWGLSESQVKDLAQVLAGEQDKQVRAFKEAIYMLGESRSAYSVEAILLADLVARGELPREEFEIACQRLSMMDSPQELELKLASLFSFEALLRDDPFAKAVEEVLPTERRAQFREERERWISNQTEAQLTLIKQQVPDLSEAQADQVKGYYRRIGFHFPRREVFEEFLTDAQNAAWLASDQRTEADLLKNLTELPLIGPGGERVEKDSPVMRMPLDGTPQVYPWKDPMTLDRAELEARRMTEGRTTSETIEVGGAGATTEEVIRQVISE